ncbi:hypothetical protein JNW90_13250 [Micromonospora sp. STR1s_5]|nr:hypothetical protein [Micromonospora sp. STR1s_5]
MSNSSETLVAKLRHLLRLANDSNSRLTAAAIGKHLQEFSSHGYGDPRAIAAVREASLALMLALHGRGDVQQCRAAGTRSIDYLEAITMLVAAQNEAPQTWPEAA